MRMPSDWLNTRNILLSIVTIGLLLRLVYVFTQHDDIYWIDGVEYHALAQQIVNGNGYTESDGTPTAFRPVGYPLLLALLSKVGGAGLLWIRIVQVFFSVVTILVVFLLVRQLLGVIPALISAFVTAIYPYFVYLPGAILPTCWFSFLIVLGVYFLITGMREDRIIQTSMAGVVFGLAVLTRPSAVVLVFVSLVWMFLSNLSKPNKAKSEPKSKVFNSLKTKLAPAKSLVFTLCVFLVVIPWVYRNYTVLGKPVIATNGGRNFWLGNNNAATATSGNNVALPKTLENRLVAMHSEIKRDRIYFSEGKKFIQQHPVKFLKLSFAKAINFWRFDPLPTSGYPKMEGLSRLIGTISSILLFIFGFVGLLIAWKYIKTEAALLLMYFLAFTMLHAIFISKVRMRLPLDHFVAIFSSIAIQKVLEWCRSLVSVISLRSRFKLGTPEGANSISI